MIAGFNARLSDTEVFLFMTRDTALQRDAVVDMRALEEEAEWVKADCNKAGDETGANLMLAFQCAADSYAEELQMWIALKSDQPDDAWNHLVGAQEANDALLRLKAPFGAVERRGGRLLQLEGLVFPPQAFISAGCIVEASYCSVCKSDYDACHHIAGRAYRGRFASQIPVKIRGDHVALVDVPADKRCRATLISHEGRARSKMTWRVSDKPLAESSMEGIFMSLGGRWGRIRFGTGESGKRSWRIAD
ncbi:MAG: hypothetical protein EON96_00810 [Caulobacteraceae bacterium]|nr:MAG: hypothetical protein EON96_00810 [Caulobacteraceae bacterium]